MIVSFRNRETRAVYDNESTRTAQRLLPAELWRTAQRKLDQMRRVTRREQLSVPPGNRLKALRGDRAGQHSIRINDQYRICFIWTDRGPAEVEITDYH
ncbi:type II toxin-antitoxin system RelE/ParE family toxin [soil metagenome]